MFEKPLGLRENPFLAGHHPKYLFPSREHQEALAHLRYGIQNREPFVLITGEVGTGKTTAVYDALAEWGSRAVVALITNSALTRAELMEEICLRFGVAIPAPMSKPHALIELQKQLSAVRGRGELAILLVDEAQNLGRELLEEIRLLSNLEVGGEYLLQIFLVGQTELETNLAQKELRQLRQRIAIHYRILPLSDAETARYIHHRVAVAGGNAEELFPADTCIEIFRLTHGIPREINIVAGQSLLNAFVEDSRSVTIEHVRGVEKEIEFQSVLRHQAGRIEQPAEPAEGTHQQEWQPPRPGPFAPPVAAVTALPLASAHDAGAVESSRMAPAPPLEYAARGEMSEDESAFGEVLPDTDDAPVDEFPVSDEPRHADDDIEEISTPAMRSGEGDLTLPSWIDEIVARRQAFDMRAAAPPPPASGAPLATHPGPFPNVLEPVGGFVHSAPAPPSGAMLAAPPPERIAPHPAEPIPLFDRGADVSDRLPPRLRDKLSEHEEPEPGRRNSLGWPIASLVIAAIAIAVLLVGRFGPWSLQRKDVAPAGARSPAGAPDTSVQSLGPFPPLDGMGEVGGGTITTTVPIGGQPPATTSLGPGAAPASAMGEPAKSAPAEPASRSPSGGTTPGPSSTQAAPGATGDPARADVRSVPTGLPSFGIVVGTFLNERRAQAERTRLSGSTQFTTRVIPVAEDTVSMYRVVVGSFGDRMSAERAASELVQTGVVSEARVVSIARPVSTRP